MDWEECKYDTARGRERNKTLSRRNRHKRRSGSEQGRLKKIGNSSANKFCSHCKPTLRNSIDRRVDDKVRLQYELDEMLVELAYHKYIKTGQPIISGRKGELITRRTSLTFDLFVKSAFEELERRNTYLREVVEDNEIRRTNEKDEGWRDIDNDISSDWEII